MSVSVAKYHSDFSNTAETAQRKIIELLAERVDARVASIVSDRVSATETVKRRTLSVMAWKALKLYVVASTIAETVHPFS